MVVFAFNSRRFFADDSILRTICGSPLYVAPEILDIGVSSETVSQYFASLSVEYHLKTRLLFSVHTCCGHVEHRCYPLHFAFGMISLYIRDLIYL